MHRKCTIKATFFSKIFHLYFTLPTTSPKQPEKLKWERYEIPSKCQNRHDINSDKLDSHFYRCCKSAMVIDQFDSFYVSHTYFSLNFRSVLRDVPVIARTSLRVLPFASSDISLSYVIRYSSSLFLYPSFLPTRPPFAL